MAEKLSIVVRQRNTVRRLDAGDVLYIESMGRKVALHLRDETIEYYALIGSLEKQLQPVFFRVHRAYLINLHYVKGYNKREVQMADGNSLLISKYRLAEFRKTLERRNWQKL